MALFLLHFVIWIQLIYPHPFGSVDQFLKIIIISSSLLLNVAFPEKSTHFLEAFRSLINRFCGNLHLLFNSIHSVMLTNS